MAMNFGYIKSLVGILKLASIVLLIIAYSTGMHGYLSSAYNKGCVSPTPSPDPTRPTTPSYLTTANSTSTSSNSSSPSPTTTLRPTSTTPTSTPPRQNSSSSSPSISTTTQTSGPTIKTTTTTIIPDKDVISGCDKMPILWMERFHLVISGTCIVMSVIMLILHLAKEDLLDNTKFRGVDFCYHFFGAIWLIVSFVFMAYSATKIDSLAEELCTEDPSNCQLMKEKMTAAAFALFAGIVFIAIGVKSFGKKFYQTV